MREPFTIGLYAEHMPDDQHDESAESPAPGSEPTHPRDEPLKIAWGFVTFLVFAALLAIFAIQNSEKVAIEFLWLELELSVWVIVVAVVFLTLVFDQIVSFFYRRRKRRVRIAGAAKD